MNEMDDKEFYLYYLNDLSYIPRPSKWIESIIKIPLLKTTLEYISFNHAMASHILLSFLTDLTLPLSQPFNFAVMILTFFIILLILFPVSIILEICKKLDLFNFNFYEMDEWNRMTAGKGSNDIKHIAREGHRALCSSDYNSKVFNFDLVETLLILSAIIYERDDDELRKIYEKLKTNKDNEGDSFENLIDECRNKVYKGINRKVKDLGFNFVPLSELNSIDTLFAGMYLFEHKNDQEDQENNNVIIVSFKGTSPTNFTEWLTDFLIMRADASQFVFGEIHKGFYDNFFPKTLDETKESYPAKRMVETISKAAEKMYERNDLLFRLIKMSTLLPEFCVLRDAYAFAAPAVGDKDFASSFNGALQINYKENKTLWRIANTNDIVAKMPPQHLYSTIRRYITKEDILNYYSIGYKVQLFLDKEKPPKGIVLREKYKEKNKDDEEEENDKLGSIEKLLRKKLNDDRKDSENSEITFDNILNFILGELPGKLPGKLLKQNKHNIESYHDYDKNHSSEDYTLDKIKNIEPYIPSLIHNHFPHRYFMAMERLRSDKFEFIVGDQKSVEDKILADFNMVM
ncbi:hypothetical protein RirG_121450 [Rhizophagus irregularis DAOM 197198w]|uniref:Fungal lipase-type domain-containing protein n=1 Tax=Rhizophagus irregularis (strain DAOM 197198w) TaxID=1432141 RepID=A0A015KGX0_RHIIW|nr:hypothetical protein RirG_121450 [Rhizophagus irregularis DAOM 197198w]